MTTVTANLQDVAGIPDNTSLLFTSVLRENGDGDAIVTRRRVRVQPASGVLTVDLDPGYSEVLFGGGKFIIDVPDTGTHDLWGLIAAAIAAPPGTPAAAIAAAVEAYLDEHPPATGDEYHEYANLAAFPGTGSTDRIYVAQDSGNFYRWTGSEYTRTAGGGDVAVVTYSGSLSTARPSVPAVYWVNFPSTPTNAQAQDIIAGSATAVESLIHAATGKTTPVDADELALVDSAASNALKKLTWANLKATLKTYFDSLTTTLSNKTLDNTSTITVKDTSFTLQDAADVTKQVTFDVSSSQTTSTARAFTLPTVSGILATLAGTETLANKTLNGATINSPAGLAKADVGLSNVDNTSNATERAASATLANKTLTNPTITNYTESVVAIGNTSTAKTIDLTNGTLQTATLTGNCTFTMPTATAGKSFTLLLNTGAGSFTGTFTSVKWSGGTAPTITATAARLDILAFTSDGANWYGSFTQNYTP